MVGVGRDLCGPSSPTLLLKQGNASITYLSTLLKGGGGEGRKKGEARETHAYLRYQEV